MKIHCYKSNEGIRELLEKVPYEWRATGTFGAERTLKNGYPTSVFMIYVKTKNFDEWEEYLKFNSIMPANLLADLKLISIDRLPIPDNQDSHTVNLGRLIRDIYKMAPRYRETHPEEIRQLKEKIA